MSDTNNMGGIEDIKVKTTSTSSSESLKDIPQFNNKSNVSIKPEKKIIELRPKLGGFLAAYIIFSLPGFFFSIAILLLVVVITIGTIAGLSSFEQNSQTNKLELNEIRSSSYSEGILVYSLNGQILSGGSDLPISNRNTVIYTDIVKEDFKKIKENKDIKNVVIKIDTPGGEVFASKILGDLLEDLRVYFNHGKLVFYYDQVVASGGLLATCKTQNQVIASPYGETGSIGVIMTLPNFKGTADKIGYSETVIKSSESKDIGNPFRDPTKSEISYFQDMVDTEFNSFKDCVSKGRNISLDNLNKFANGLVFSNEKAKSYGLVDDLGSLDKAIEISALNANLGGNYKVWEVKQEVDIFQNLLGAKSFQDILKLTQVTSQFSNRVVSLYSGKIYAIDEYRI